MAYIWEWVRELHGRSGVTMSGLAPLSHQEIEAWQRLHEIELTPLEVEALIAVDSALISASAPEEAETEEASESPPPSRWPTRKAHG